MGSFQHCIGDVGEGGGEVRQVRLYSRLPRAQKSQKCKFVHDCSSRHMYAL